MGKKPQVEEGEQGAPDWIVTFTDLVSLLVAFFVLLMTFSSLNSWDSFQVRGDLLGMSGIITDSGGSSAVDPPEDDLMQAMDAVRGATHAHSRPTDKLVENLEEMGQKKDENHVEIDLSTVKDGIVIRFNDRATFAPGSVEVNSILTKALAQLGTTLENYRHMITVEGYTDNAFQATPEYPTPEALSFARAAAAADAMTRNSGMSPLMIQLAGLGMRNQLNENQSPFERSLNRRVEVRIMALSQARENVIEKGEPR